MKVLIYDFFMALPRLYSVILSEGKKVRGEKMIISH